MTPEQIIVAVIDRKFDAAMPGWWPDTEEWAAESVAALRAAGLLPGPDDIVVSREALTVLLDLLKEKLLHEPLPMLRSKTFWREDLDVIADAVAALSQPHPEETP